MALRTAAEEKDFSGRLPAAGILFIIEGGASVLGGGRRVRWLLVFTLPRTSDISYLRQEAERIARSGVSRPL